MPSKSVAEQHFMGWQLHQKEAGKPVETKMSVKQLKDFASTPTKGLPARVKKS